MHIACDSEEGGRSSFAVYTGVLLTYNHNANRLVVRPVFEYTN